MVKATDVFNGETGETYFDNIEKEEVTRGARIVETNYPRPIRRLKLIWEIYNQSVEEAYFFLMTQLQETTGYPKIEKLIDSFAASENSAFGGISMQRLTMQQEKLGQFLATIGKMVKELFQLVRELRIIEERLSLYNATYTKNDIPAEITLKGYWIDMVEQAGKGPTAASVYGMARELGFATLPDLFFGSPPMKTSEIQDYVEGIQVNRKVREVLKRKLMAFLTWKDHTYKEMNNRFNFTIKYLRQHYDIIRLYMNWVKPYLRAIKKLSMDEKKLASPEMISSFEGAMTEVELLASKPIGKYYNACMLVSLLYRARPTMSYTQEGYQRGPIMVGKTTIILRTYVWSKYQMYKFKQMKEKEDLELMGSYDATLKDAMENLGDDLKRFLALAGEKFGEKKAGEKPEPIKGTVLEPFISIVKGFGQLFGAFGGPYAKKIETEAKCIKCGTKIKINDQYCETCGFFLQKRSAALEYKWNKDKAKAKSLLDAEIWLVYKSFKSGHGFLTW